MISEKGMPGSYWPVGSYLHCYQDPEDEFLHILQLGNLTGNVQARLITQCQRLDQIRCLEQTGSLSMFLKKGKLLIVHREALVSLQLTMCEAVKAPDSLLTSNSL